MFGLFREQLGSSGGRSGGGNGNEHEVNCELKTEFMQLWDGIQGSTSNQYIVVISGMLFVLFQVCFTFGIHCYDFMSIFSLSFLISMMRYLMIIFVLHYVCS